jgi:membrane associated rhomboid family serine protease
MDIQLLLHAPATLALLAANILISMAGFNNPKLVDAMMMDVGRMRRNNEWYRAITSGFVHADGFHLLVNMYALFIFGPFLELTVGTAPFALLYALSLLSGSAWAYLENFRAKNYRALGASGAISGVTVAGAMFAPFTTILAFFVIPMPLILFAFLYILYSAFASGRIQDGIGHAAHLGGALGGLVMVCLFWPEAPRSLWEQILTRF